jgi:hypothetical protein
MFILSSVTTEIHEDVFQTLFPFFFDSVFRQLFVDGTALIYSALTLHHKLINKDNV